MLELDTNRDSAQPSILVLLELHRICPDVFDQLHIYIDGGFDRGSDILKAIALGATAVGVGRPYLYSLTYGEEGVEHLTQSKLLLSIFIQRSFPDVRLVLKDEIETSMRLCGITDINQAHPGLVNTRDIDHMVMEKENEHPYIRWKPKAML